MMQKRNEMGFGEKQPTYLIITGNVENLVLKVVSDGPMTARIQYHEQANRDEGEDTLTILKIFK